MAMIDSSVHFSFWSRFFLWLFSVSDSLLIINLISVAVLIMASELAVRVVSSVTEGWRLMVWNMELMFINIVSIVMKVVMGVMSMVKFLMLPLIMDLIDKH